MKAIGFFIFLAIFALGFSQSDGQNEVSKTVQKAVAIPKTDNEEEIYRIGFQDTLDIQVYSKPLLSQKVSINPDGTVTLFRARKPLPAICKTERELAEDIQKEYLSFLNKPEVIVYVTEKHSQSFGLIGAVEKPGTYYVNRKIRLLELLSIAGGPNKEAGSRMIVARTGSSSACKIESDDSVIKNDLVLMNFKVKEVLEGKQNLWMQPGDIVSVLDSDVVYIYGNVNKVGAIRMGEPLTLTQAIVSAQGLKPTAKNLIKILRQKEGTSDREEIIVNIKDIEKRKVQDPFLEPNDIVAVSEDSTKVILRGIKQTIQNTIPSFIYKLP